MKISTRYAVLFLLLTLSSFSSFGLTAGFNADVVAGCSPLVVHFTNTTTPTSGTTYRWDFGNGDPAAYSTDASTSFILTGTYTVTLTATNGGTTSTHTMTITVYPSPTVSFYANDTTVCPGTTVTFTSTTTGGVPGPVTCTWNFGDGFSGSGSPVTHTYTSPGFYNVTLSATNADGCVSSLTKTAYIQIYTPPAPNFSATAYYCHPPAHVVFTNLTSGTPPLTYVWNFGDGSPTVTGTAPTHDYALTGSYTVTLIATDGHGCSDTLVEPAYITVANGFANFTYPSSVCVGSTVTFTDVSSTHTSADWSYGDGGTSTGDPGMHTYSTPGTYTVRLITSAGSSCHDTITHTITVLAGPAISFSVTPTQPCPPPSAITFAGTAPSGVSVSWLYGDGGTGAGTTSTHTYGSAGTYTIRMIGYDPSTGCRDTVSRSVTIYDLQFHAHAVPTHGCKPLTVNFSTSAVTTTPTSGTYPYSFSSYSWVFGDGGTGAGGTPTHVYTAVGTYWAVVTAVTSNGCTVRDSVEISVGTPPVVTFTATPTHQCYHNNNINFTVTVISGPVDSFYWIFDDGTGGTSYGLTYNHHYVLPGVFGATVIPIYHGCPGPPFGLSRIITIDSPMSVIRDSIYCSPAKRVQFGDSSLGDDTHVWIFGDLTTSTVDNPLHDYPALSVYTVTLTTYNVRSGCRDTGNTLIDLRRPIPNITGDTAICRDSFVTLHAIITGSGFVSAYYWHSAGWSPDSNSATYVDTFHTRGIYPVMLVIEDQNNCLDTIIKTNYIHVAKPVASFTVTPPSGCWPLTATFTDASNDIPGTFYTNYNWDFGDLTSASVPTSPTTHTYYSAGTYTITEIVTDNIGCKDTTTRTGVTVYRPHAVFSASNLHPCATDSTHFLNTSTGITSSFWMFGDGGTSTLNSPWHQYTAPGSYTVKLVVTDSHGCTDTATYVAYINVSKPVASFYMDDSVSICPPLMVHFHNTSTGGIFYNWTMGDGSSSMLFAPSDLYIVPGSDTVILVVSDAYGCRDTAYGHTTIFGYNGAFSYAPTTGCSPLVVNFHANTLNVPSIIWDFADGTTSAAAFTDSISHTYVRPGAYVPKLILSDNTGCQASSIGLDTIKVDLVTADFVPVPNPVCLGDSFTLVDSAASYWSTITGVSWTINGGTTTVDTPSFFINNTGTYPAVLVVTDGWGCTATVNKNVTIYPPPVIKVTPDTTICVGDAATLMAYGGVTYTWAPPVNLSCTACNPTHASPSVVTTYTVTGKDAVGCINTDTTTVFLRTTTTAIARGDTQICFGAFVPLFDSGGTRYWWLPTAGLSNPNIPDPMASPPSTTTYMAIAQLAGCTPDTNYVTVVVHPLPTVDAGPDQTLIAGSVAQLNATGHLVARYMWDQSPTLSCDSCPNPTATMSVTTTYFITVATDFGCLNSDSVTIHIFCDNSQLFIPNSFTPNHDGENDVFYPRGTGVSKVKSFRIYNRWGELMFERSNIDLNDASNAWDGSYQGQTPRPDVYVWVIDAECETGQTLNLKGDVTIIR